MRQISSINKAKGILLIAIQCVFFVTNSFAQQPVTSITDYVIFGGTSAVLPGQKAPASPGYGVIIGSSNSVKGSTLSSIGSYKLVQTTGGFSCGTTSIKTNIYSGGTIFLSNSNSVYGDIAAANAYNAAGTILSVGTSATLKGNINVKGNIVIGGGTVTGIVTNPTTNTYKLGSITKAGIGNPTLPVLPSMPAIKTFPSTGTTDNITATRTINPGYYGNFAPGSGSTITLNGPGIYVFKSMKTTGSNNKIVYKFNSSTTGEFLIYVIGDVNLNKTIFSMTGGGSVNRIFTEVHGNGSTNTTDNTAAFIMSNGSNGSGNQSNFLGALWVPYAAIRMGAPNGPTTTVNGCLWSGTQVNLLGGVDVTYAKYNLCTAPEFSAGPDKALEFSGKATLTGTVSTSGTFNVSWAASNGGIIDSPTGTKEITVSAEGTYTFTVTNPSTGCSFSDEVKVTSKLNKITGSELQSLFENKGAENNFFDIVDGYVKIDIIAISGQRTQVINELLETPARPDYLGLKDTVPNGFSGLTITGRFPVDSLLKLNTLGNIINYCRPYYKAILFNATGTDEGDTSRVGLIRSEGDTAMKSHLVRSGFSIYGDGIKIGVMSDSYSSLTSGTTATLPLQPVKKAPFIISPSTLDTIGTINPIPQTFNTNTAAIDVSNRDLPANVIELPAFPVNGTDEGRAMLQIVHDVAPGAELYFRTGFNTAGDFAKGIKELKDAGCNIIVDDITYPTEPFLRDGIVAKTVNDMKAAGITYFSSAGNFGNRSYEKNFTPINFNGKVAHNFGGGDVFQKIKLAPGDYTFVFQWVDNIYSLSETVGTVNDFDIYLTKKEDGTGLVGFNRDNTVGDPIEFIPITVPAGDSVEYNVFIVNNTPNSTNPRMKYIVFRGNPRIMEFNEGGSTIVGQANAEGAIAVGASRFNHIPGHPLLPTKLKNITKPQIESFSSVGGTWVNGTARQKPDLVGPDGGNTTVKLGQDYPDWALDGFSNFFGTSAAAPHVAAAAALIMEGRKKFLGATTTTPDQIKALLQGTAVDMETPGFDLISGNGLVDVDSAMRTFAAPKPRSIKLVVPVTNPITIPGDKPFLLTVTGENFSANSEIWYGDQKLVTVYMSPTKDTIQAWIPAFTENVEIRVYTNPKTTAPTPLDGGFSNSLFFFDADIVVRAVNTNIKYGQDIPVLDTIITINGKLLQDTTLSLADIGLAKMKLSTTAPAYGFVGTYKITPSFDPTDMPGDELLIKYNYQFIDAQLSVAKMPLKVTPNNKSIVYGQPLGNITYKYDFEPGSLPSNVDDWRQVIKLYHETILPNNALAVIKDFGKDQLDGGKLNTGNLTNLNMMVTFNALINSGKYIIENGKLVPVSNLPTLNGLYLVDVASESIYNYIKDPATAALFAANPAYSAKAVLGANALTAKTATVQIPNGGGGLAQMVNGIVSEVAGISTGPVVPIVNNNLIQVLNAKIVTFLNNEWVPVAANATDSIQIVNNQLTKFVNGVPQVLADGVIVQVNGGGGLAQLVNGGGGLAQLVNGGGGLAQLVNGVVNSDDLVFANGVVNVVTNGGGGLAQLVNGTLIAFPNGGGGLAQLVNGGGGLAQLVNGGGGLAQLVNGGGGLAQLVNGGGGLAQLVNGGGGGGLAQLVNGGGGLAQLVNGGGGLAQLVNGSVIGAGSGTNNNTAVILDESNINHPKTGNWLGAMFGINMVTGLDVGNQKIIPGIFVNPNFDITYGLGELDIQPETITITPDEGQKKIYGAEDPTFTYKATNIPAFGATFTGKLGRTTGETVVGGPYPYTLGNLSAGSNYLLTLAGSNTFAITPKAITVEAIAGQTKVYGNNDPTFTYTPSEALLAGNSFVGALGRDPGENVTDGPYAYTIGNLNAGTNYTVTLTGTNTFDITERPVTVTPTAGQSKFYGNIDPTFTYTSSEALKPGNSFSGALARIAGETVAGGPYAYTPGNLTAGTNYTITLGGTNTFAIKARPINITANAGQSKVYGEIDPAFAYTAGEALQAGDNYSGALERIAGENVAGSPYAFTIGTLSAGSNYLLTLTGTNKFAITKRSLTILPNAGQSKVYGSVDPTFTYTSSEALKTGNSFSGALSRISGESVSGGPYAFAIGTLSAGNNYTLTLNPTNKFAITPAPLKVKADDKYISKGDAKPTFTGVITGLKFNDIVTVTYTTNYVTGNAAGTYWIKPSAVSNANYTLNPADITNGTLYVNPKGTGIDDVDVYVDCVEDRGSGYLPANRRYVAHFYAKNENSVPVYVPIGADNKLSSSITTGSPFDGSQQPVVFLPGKGTTKFDVPFDGNNLKWELRTWEVNTKVLESATASKSSRRTCTYYKPPTIYSRAANTTIVKEPLTAKMEILPGSNVNVFPNPVRSRSTIYIANEIVDGKRSLLFDSYGKSLPIKIVSQKSTHSFEIDLSGVASGMYFLKVKVSDGYKAISILKQ